MKVSVNRQTPLRLARRARPWGRLLRLEDRITPAVTWAFDKVTGIVTATGDAANDVIVFTRNQNQFVEVNGTPVAIGSPGQLIPVKDMTGLYIDAGAGDDQIDLLSFSFGGTGLLPPIRSWVEDHVSTDDEAVELSGGQGNDTITGSMYADRIIGGDGGDVINAGGGDDLIEGTWDELTADTLIDGGTGVNAMALELPGTSPTLAAQVDTVTAALQLGYGGKTASLLNVDGVTVTIAAGQGQVLTFAGGNSGPSTGVTWDVASQTDHYIPLKGIEEKPKFKDIDLSFRRTSPTTGEISTENFSFSFGQIKIAYALTGSAADDTFTVNPGTDSIDIVGGAGADTLLVNHGGLPVSTVGSSVIVQGKAPVSFTDVETVTNGLHLFGDGASEALADNKVSITSAPGLSPDVTVFTVSNGGDRPMESISFNFSKIEYRYSPETRVNSAGVTVSESFFDEGVSLADRAAGVSPGRKDITFSLPPLAPGQSATFGLRDYQGTMPYFEDIAELKVQYVLGASPTVGAPFSGEYEGTIDSSGTVGNGGNVILDRVSPPGGSTLEGSTAGGVPLTLNAAAGVDPYVTTFSAGTHLYLGGQMVDVAPDGKTSGNGSVSQASVNYDGSAVAFVSTATNLVSGATDANNFPDVFVSIAGGNQGGYARLCLYVSSPLANGPSRNPQVSGDGSAVYFESLASNLVPGVSDTNNDWDLLRFDLATGQVDYVNRVTPVFMANRGINHWGDRADGKAAVFTTLATNVGSGVGLQIGVTSALGTSFVALPSYVEGVHNHRVAMSPDGSTVALWTDADVSSLAGVPDTNGKLDLLTIDTATMQVTLQSRNAAGTATGNGATPAKLDANFDFFFDGSFATTTTAADLAGATLATDDAALISKSRSGNSVWNFHVWTNSMSNVSCDSTQPNVATCTDSDLRSLGAPDLPAIQGWAFDLASKTFSLISMDAAGNPASADVTSLRLANGGRQAVFTTAAKLVAADTDALADVYSSVAHRSLIVPGGLGGTPRKFIRGEEGYEVQDFNTGSKVASRPASITDYVFLTGTPGNDSLTIDMESGLTGLTGVRFDGGAGADLFAYKLELGGSTCVVDDVCLVAYDDATVASVTIRVIGAETIDLGAGATSGELVLDHTASPASKLSFFDNNGNWVCEDECLTHETTILCGETDHLRVIGGGGNDTITVTGNLPVGQLSIFGEDGSDVIDASTSGIGVFASGGGGSDTVTGSPFADIIACVRRPDVIFGGLGNDVFIVSPDGGDTIDFGGGLDTLDFSIMDRPVTIDLDKTGPQTFTGSGEVLTLTQPAENFIGSAYDDAVTAKFKPEVTRKYSSGGAVTQDALTVDAEAQAVFLDRAPSGVGVALRISFKDIIELSPSDKGLNVTIANGSPPQAPTAYINGGAPQRSMVGDLAVPFNFDAQFVGDPSAAFQLQTKAGVPVPFSVEVVRFAGLATAYLTPSNLVNGSMPDGRYVLTVLTSQIVGGLPGNADAISEFHRQFGDINGDTYTDNVDFVAYRQCNGSDSTSANYNPAFDSNGDGFIDNVDFIAFRQRIGMSP